MNIVAMAISPDLWFWGCIGGLVAMLVGILLWLSR